MTQGPRESLQTPPVLRIAPPGDLQAYIVYEHELDHIAQGGSGSLFLNFGLSLLSIFATLFATLITLNIPEGYAYQSFFSACLVTGISAAVLLALWWKNRRSSAQLLDQVKNRMPPAPGIQEPLSSKPGSTSAET